MPPTCPKTHKSATWGLHATHVPFVEFARPVEGLLEDSLVMVGLSLMCGDYGHQLRRIQEAQEHVELIGHANFSESTEAVLNLVCTACGKPCHSKIEIDLHTKRTGHSEFTDKTEEAAKPIDLESKVSPYLDHLNLLLERISSFSKVWRWYDSICHLVHRFNAFVKNVEILDSSSCIV